eukprot:5044658-Pleurochrysis_carterae.AAC.1
MLARAHAPTKSTHAQRAPTQEMHARAHAHTEARAHTSGRCLLGLLKVFPALSAEVLQKCDRFKTSPNLRNGEANTRELAHRALARVRNRLRHDRLSRRRRLGGPCGRAVWRGQ